MGKVKELLSNAEYARKFLDERNNAQHIWHEDMPDLQGQALAAAEEAFDHWVQLELDLWEGRHGINECTIWDMAQGGTRG